MGNFLVQSGRSDFDHGTACTEDDPTADELPFVLRESVEDSADDEQGVTCEDAWSTAPDVGNEAADETEDEGGHEE